MEQTTNWLIKVASFLPWVGLFMAVLIVIALLIKVGLTIFDMRRLYKQKSVLLEITPPATSEKTPHATQQLFSVLHGLSGAQPWQDKLLRRKVTLSIEISSTREEGIRFTAFVPETELTAFKKRVASYSPDARFRVIKDYLPSDLDYKKVRVLEFGQTGHFAFPLRIEESSLEQHDPIAYLTGAMTQLELGELVSFQLVISPAHVTEAASISRKILTNEALIHQLGNGRTSLFRHILRSINTVILGILGLIPDLFGPSKESLRLNQVSLQHKQQVAEGQKPARVLTPFEQQLVQSVHNKVSQPLFQANIRALVIANEKSGEKQRVRDIKSSLAIFSVPGYQSLKARHNFPAWMRGRFRVFTFKHRLPTMFRGNSSILAASELADMYHFPHGQTAKTENVVKSLSKTLSAPISLKKGTKLDVLLGQNQHLGASTNIGLTAEERERHVFIVGGTGAGKTTMLKYAIVQDILAGKGVAVIDPHGDLAQELLAYIPKERINDVIYFNPSDVSYPIGLNLLEVPKGLTGDQLLKAQDFIAETVVSIMRKTFSDDGTGGHRIEYVLRNAVLTALTVKDATLFTVYDLLTNKDFRKPIVAKLEQDWLKNFWRNEFSKAGDYQQVKMMSGVTSKIGRYHASVSAERVLEQPKSTIDFEEILDGKILVCNLAKGLIGEDTSEVFGISILAKLQLASFRRIEQKSKERRPFYAYVDEFQNFATVSFTQMLSEARKYKLFLIMAEQTTSQQDDDKMVNTIMTNAGTIICFKSNSLADERQMLHLFNGKVDPGEIANLPIYNFYAKLSGGPEPQDPVSGMTVVLDDDGDEEIAEAVIVASRKNYAKKYVVKKKKKTRTQKSDARNDKQRKNSEEAEDGLLADADGKG